MLVDEHEPPFDFARRGSSTEAHTKSELVEPRTRTTMIALLASSMPSAQCENRVDRVQRNFGIRPMLTRPGATAGMVRDLDKRQSGHAKKLCLRLTQFHKYGLTECHSRLSPLLNLNSIVDTPRRTRPSSSKPGDDRVAPADQLVKHGLGGFLHVSRLFSQEDFSRVISFLEKSR